MKRLVIFAHYDVHGLIADHVVYYLNHLQLVSSTILFSSDCELRAGEVSKLRGLAVLVHASRHHGYDFGSWQKCLNHIDFDLSPWDELIVANDSCFAPLHSLIETFELIGKCDFWGATKEWYSDVKAELRRGPLDQSTPKLTIADIRNDFTFLNSYFMVFKKKVLQHSDFAKFWKSIEPQSDKGAVIEFYEMDLTRRLVSLGFTFQSIATRSGMIVYRSFNVKVPKGYQFPWLRVLLCLKNSERVAHVNRVLEEIEYPRIYIDDYVSRLIGKAKPDHYFLDEEAMIWRTKRHIGLALAACTYWIKRIFALLYFSPSGQVRLTSLGKKRTISCDTTSP